MKPNSLVFLLLGMCMLIGGCGGSPEETATTETGSAVLSLQWTDEKTASIATEPAGAALLRRAETTSDLEALAGLSDDCAARGVVTVSVEVADERENWLASAEFACEAGQGLVENIAVGTDRYFLVRGLDEIGNERYRGEKTGVTIKRGENEVGTIEMVNVTSSPIAVVSEPGDDSVFTAGSAVTFAGSASDGEDGILRGGSLTWTSSVDQQFGSGTSVTTETLSPGMHTITLTAVDSDGNTDSTSISLFINEPPAVEINTPESNASFPQGAAVSFNCTAEDSEDGELSGDALVWTSSIDGELGTGAGFATQGLSTGTHSILVTATDSRQAAAEAGVTITIEPANEPPAVTIARPYKGSFHSREAAVFFEGSAVDPEDGRLSGGSSLIWTYAYETVREIGYGHSFMASSFPPGTHTITLTATDSQGAEATATTSITVVSNRLPDTGQTASYTETFGEDGDYTIHPPAYVKLDGVGNELPQEATSWAMVRDRVTGLVWEIKSPDEGSIHSQYENYAWGDAMDKFIYGLNQMGFGGYTDWRLPTVKELYSLINMGNSDLPVDQRYFPHVNAPYNSCFWSATPVAGNPGQYWAVDFYWGRSCTEGQGNAARAVRGPELAAGGLLTNPDGTETDPASGLMWHTETLEEGLTWEQALSYCENLMHSGYADWRLPNRRELHSRFDYGLERHFFLSGHWWSSTSDPRDSSRAYGLYFNGEGDYLDKTVATRFITAVRGGQ
jgi:hypothetical protein